MGMFDSLMVTCPYCGKMVEFQSKAGDCICAEYSATNVPDEIAVDVKDDVSCCEKCGRDVRLNVQVIKVITAY